MLAAVTPTKTHNKILCDRAILSYIVQSFPEMPLTVFPPKFSCRTFILREWENKRQDSDVIAKITEPFARARWNSCPNWDGFNLLLSAEYLFSLHFCSSIQHTVSVCFLCSWALNNYTCSTISEESSSISSPLNINPVWEHMPLLYKPGWEIGTNR